MRKHTPGPWEIHDNIGRSSEIGVVADAAPCIIAVMGNAKAWPAEARANTLLIAAAPDLLAALCDVQAALACHRDGVTYRHPVHGQIALEEVKYLIVDPVIAKATGEA